MDKKCPKLKSSYAKVIVMWPIDKQSFEKLFFPK